MKKFLSTLLLTLAVFYGKSQLIINEVYSDPSKQKNYNEFFELYNTNVNASAVQLDCYTLVTYWKASNNDSGFYVLDMPNIGLKNQKYYVGASAINITVQGTSATADFNWNSLGSTGYLKKYKVIRNGNVYSYNDITSTDITSTYNDIFQSAQGGGDLAVFLFKEGVYVNGLIAGFNTNPPTSLPTQISNMPNLPVNYVSSLNSTCTGSFMINWRNITKAEFPTGGGTGGTDNGFARAYDGNCGSWVKTASSPNHTPGRANVPGNATVTNSIQTSERRICGTQIDYQILSATYQTAFPVNVQLYIDANANGNLDVIDPFTPVFDTTITSTSNNTYSIYSLDPTIKYVIVYKTGLGCYDKIIAPTVVTGNLLTTQTSMCGKRIDFTITGASSTAVANYTINKDVSVQLLINGSPVGSAKTITLSSFPYSSSIQVPSDYSPISSTKNVELSFTPFYSCLSSTGTATYSKPTITLSGDITCASKTDMKSAGVSYSILNVSDPVAYPITLKYVEDNATPTNIADDITGESQHIPTGPPFTVYSATLMNIKSNVTLYAESDQAGCATTSITVPNTCVVLPVHFQSFTAARNKQKKEEVLLKWQTATEQNNRGFYVQRKVTGQWKNIAFVFSQADNGNSNTTLAYEYKDNNISNTVTQYQIQQVDMDGKTSYSDIKSVLGLEQKNSVLIYPNPGVNGKVNLLFSEMGSVKDVIVSDMNGRVVKQFRQVANNSLTLEGLQSGLYTIKITDHTTETTTVEKVIIK